MPTADPKLAAHDLADLLRFYADAGVDEALGEEPFDRFAETAEAEAARLSPRRKAAGGDAPQAQRRGEPPLPSAPPLPARVSAPSMAVPDEAQAARARDLARQAGSLEELREILDGFTGCNLKFTAKQTVFSDGNPQAPLMLVGEAPGRDEDIEGKPFVGRSGRLLDRMLAAIGVARADGAYIANVIPWRPPGNRTPTPLETELCRPFIERQIELANPKVLVTLGGPSAKVLLNATEGVLKMRGKWKTHVTASGVEIPTMPTLHPAYLLRNPAHKKLAWRDFLEIAAKLDATSG
jgi:DNA polymerase